MPAIGDRTQDAVVEVPTPVHAADDVEPAGDVRPAAQAVQDVAPVEEEAYVFATHCLHAVAPEEEEKYPELHSVGEA